MQMRKKRAYVNHQVNNTVFSVIHFWGRKGLKVDILDVGRRLGLNVQLPGTDGRFTRCWDR